MPNEDLLPWMGLSGRTGYVRFFLAIIGTLIALIVGGVLGDWIKGPLPGTLPPDLARGVALHRAIDSHAETHPAFQRSRNRVSPARRRYAGILVDIYYDHLLARDWPQHPPLADTCEQIYRHIADRLTAGATLDDCRHVLAVREAEVKAKPDSAQWFDAVTPFRPDQFAKALAASPGANGSSAPLAHIALPRLTRPA